MLRLDVKYLLNLIRPRRGPLYFLRPQSGPFTPLKVVVTSDGCLRDGLAYFHELFGSVHFLDLYKFGPGWVRLSRELV